MSVEKYETIRKFEPTEEKVKMLVDFLLNESLYMSDEHRRLNPEGAIFERRRFVRIGGSFIVSYTDISTAQLKTDITQTKDISLGGILFTTDKKLKSGSVLRIKVRVPESPDYLNLKVSVVHSKERVKNMLYETRAKFIGISGKNRDAISRLMKYHFRKKQ